MFEDEVQEQDSAQSEGTQNESGGRNGRDFGHSAYSQNWS
jgi:hypothetical protein